MTGLELKEIMKKRGLSVSALAFKLGVTHMAMQSTFKSPDVKSGIIEAAANAMGLTIDQIYNYVHAPAHIEKDQEQTPEEPTTETKKAPAASNDMQQVLLHLVALVSEQNKKIDDLTKQVADLTSVLTNQHNSVNYVFDDSDPKMVADTTEIK